MSVDGNSTLQLAFNDIIIYEDERQGSSWCKLLLLRVVCRARFPCISLESDIRSERRGERERNGKTYLMETRYSWKERNRRERERPRGAFIHREQQNKKMLKRFSTICGAFIFLFFLFFFFFFVCWGGNNLFDSSLLLARCGRSTGPMAVARFACCRSAQPSLPRCTRKSFCLMRFVIRKHRKTWWMRASVRDSPPRGILFIFFFSFSLYLFFLFSWGRWRNRKKIIINPSLFCVARVPFIFLFYFSSEKKGKTIKFFFVFWFR